MEGVDKLGNVTTQILKRATAGEQVAAQLRASIYRGDLPPGARLLQVEIGRRFGVSSTPVREALALLQAEGLVKIDPHRGAIVFRPSLEELREIYKILGNLETMAVGEAIPHLSETHFKQLQSLISIMRTTQSDLKWVELNDLFHLTLYRASSMNKLCGLIETIRDSCSVYFHLYVSSRAPEDRSDDEHQEILDACKAKDLRSAKRLTRRHVHDAMKELERLLRERNSRTALNP